MTTLPENPLKWISELDVPEWDAYFMGEVFYKAMRSPDRETKQGCVIVDWPSKTELGGGYNGHPRHHTPILSHPDGSFEHVFDKFLNERAPGTIDLREGCVVEDLPTTRDEGKYACMVHADANAVANVQGTSDHAVVYLPMPPCEVCLGLLANMPRVHVRRIVYLEYRDFPKTWKLARHLPHIKLEQYTGAAPENLLDRAATYLRVRKAFGTELSKDSAKSYTGS